MIKHGTRPLEVDRRDYSFHHSFGSAGLDVSTLPQQFLLDAGLTMPDQEEQNSQFTPPVPALPFGCTDYGGSEICIDQDQKLFNPMDLENVDHANSLGGVDMRVALASAVKVYGRKAYFNVSPAGGLDWFDTVRAAIWINQPERRSCVIGSIWYPQWESMTESSGMLVYPSELQLTGPWHCYKIDGWVTIGGYLYLRVKSWQGKDFGDKGWAYMSRPVFNAIMSVNGACAFTISEVQPPKIVDFTFISQFVNWITGLFNAQA